MAENKGPGYPSPLYAMKNGPREEILYVSCINPAPTEGKSDYLATIDVNPNSPTYCKIIHKAYTGYPNDQFHHFGWNTCSSCYGKECSKAKRDKIIIAGLDSDRIYIYDVGKNPRAPEIYKIINSEDVSKWDVSYLHSYHCLPSGEVMISHMGDKNGNSSGNFVMLDTKTWEIKGKWSDKTMDYCYDFWYQPYHDVMIVSEFGGPNTIKNGFKPSMIEHLGKSIHFYTWSTKKHIKSIDLGSDGCVGISARFLHNPKEAQGYVAGTVNSHVFRFYKDESGSWETRKVLSIKPKKVTGWIMDQMPGLLSDLIISLDDKYMYITNFLHGDVRQYDITDRENPKLTGQVFLGGLLTSDSPIKAIDGDEPPREPCSIKGHRLHGGPHRLQLSLDGKRLYASSYLYTPWDRELYPKCLENGGFLVLIHCDTEKGGLRLDHDFYIDCKDDDGLVFPHEMRYPGGDCSSDIWLVNEKEDA